MNGFKLLIDTNVVIGLQDAQPVQASLAELVRCGAAVTMVGLDVTRKTMPTPKWLADLRATNKPAARVVADLWDNPTLCFNDACVAHILRPEIFRSDKRCVEIEINNPVRIGETRVIAGEASTTALLGVDREAFFALIHDALIGTQ